MKDMKMTQYRIMSFNIRGSFINDGENNWAAREEYNCETIRKYSPDLIGFQELQEGNWQTYEQKLTEYEKLLGPRYNNSAPYCYPSVFYKPESFAFIQKGYFWLSETPDVFSSSWNTAQVRSALWVRLECKERHGRTFLFVNTHLDHMSESARVNGARAIIRRISEVRRGDEPVFVTGDFNCDPYSLAYNEFAEAGYEDTFLASGNSDNEETYTFHGFTGKRSDSCQRIDWILASGLSGFKNVKSEIVRDASPPHYPSDHYPIITDYELNITSAPIKLVAFDFDGVLADSMRHNMQVMNDVCPDFGAARQFTVDDLKNTENMSFEYLANEIGIPQEKISACTEQIRRQLLKDSEDCGIFAGMKEALKLLSAKPVQLIIITHNYKKIVDAFLKKNGIEPFFSEIIGIETRGSKAEKLISAGRRRGISPKQTAMVGDSTGDILSAIEAGVMPVGVTWGFQNPEKLFSAGAVKVLQTPKAIPGILYLTPPST